ncbi:MAG: hypothetical protein ONB06_06205 [candidate division KSB1 bacterium]|nr:hypothetical protein [candidate division KSB1 bacterium]
MAGVCPYEDVVAILHPEEPTPRQIDVQADANVDADSNMALSRRKMPLLQRRWLQGNAAKVPGARRTGRLSEEDSESRPADIIGCQ